MLPAPPDPPSRQARRRVVVSGGAGFIGTHSVATLIAEGFEVLVLDDLRHACGEPVPAAAELVAAEIGSGAAAAAVKRFRPELCLHLAAQGGVARSMLDPLGDAQVNVLGTVALLKACAEAGCRRFVFGSSGGAIYGLARRLPCAERATPQPLSPYGAAKLAAEGYLAMFSRTFRLPTLALRYSNVYGPLQDGTGEAGVVAITCERLLAGQPPQVRGDGEQTRDFVFVADIAEANLRGLASRAGGAHNVGTGRPTSVNAVISRLTEVAGYKGPVDYTPARPGEVRHTYLDLRKTQRILGWTPGTLLEEGLRLTFLSFSKRAHGRGPATAASPEPAGAAAPPGRGSLAGSG